jgi:hypothetical protein
MKRKLLIISGLLLVTTSLFAQPTITSSYAPYVGLTGYTRPIHVVGVSLGMAASNYTWDYTSLTDSGSASSQTFVNPSSTPAGNLFPSASVADGNSLAYVYIQNTSNASSIIGTAGAAEGDTLHYTTPEVVFEYPLTYQTKYNSTFAAYSTTTADGETAGDDRSGTDTIIVDGYGTLELPGGSAYTFSNILRVILIQNYMDVFTVEGEPYDTIYSRVYNVEYLTPFLPAQPLLAISNLSEMNEGYTESASSGYIYPNTNTAVNTIATLLNNVSLFPNPSATQTTLSININEASNINIYLTNILGQKVKTINTAQVDAGQHNYTIDAGDLTKGLYLVTVEVNGSIAGVRKLEVE